MRVLANYILISLLFITFVFCQNYDTEREESGIGIGYQISYPFHGLSIIVAPEIDFSFQGMFGLVGNYKSYCAKIRYHFKVAGTYTYGLLGFFSYKNNSDIVSLRDFI